MKKIAYCLLLTVYGLFATPALALEEGIICSYPEYCTLGNNINTGVRECRGRISNKICVYSADLDPQCTPCQEQISPTPIISPTPPPADKPIPTQTIAPSKTSSDEQAVYNLNKGLNPGEIAGVSKPASENIFNSLLNIAAKTINSLLGFQVFDVPRYYVQSEAIHGAYLPEEVATSSSNPTNQLKGFLGGSTGFYGATLPDLGQINNIQESEELYQQSYFPEEVKPITK